MLMAIQLMQDPATRTPFPAQRRINASVVNAAREQGLLVRALGTDIVRRITAAFDDVLPRVVAAK
ncbi:adenosylmethionine-8-amino-7-oxononanoate aminotransferase [Paraburkholderia atlantica]|uniref:Adenosylmethionine-8-amino-7-oxononanoate aminotransferase n=2 Tax=Paraburkholderia TaxID=1822464 RepID=A0A7W8P5X2_9BURK|nr:adenosylmethionine-8-amino-7-oxononanoate aminotransferase [Paraburkholderia youngii]MBB5421241.1 adenosylmethionine-8-amino-7-oxononanoate aminotransferase [Paraburkholderia atlantica]MBB5429228.1 adenosylmethionine-8-amino-7-oxononanoate aminotransferase [Paraburkholderia atlantica]